MFDMNTEYRPRPRLHISPPPLWMVPEWARFVVLNKLGWWEAHQYAPVATHTKKHGMIWKSHGPSQVIAKGPRSVTWEKELYRIKNGEYIDGRI